MNIHIHQFQSGGAVDDADALEQFQKQWATYQKLVDTDALSPDRLLSHLPLRPLKPARGLYPEDDR